MIRTESKILTAQKHFNMVYDQLTILDIDLERSEKTIGTTFVIVECSCGCVFSRQLADMLYHNTKGFPNRCKKCALKARNKGGRFLQWNWFNTILQNAKNRNLEITITIDYCEKLWEKQNGKCALSGIDLLLPKRIHYTKEDGKKSISYHGDASIDRIDSYKGYLEGNVQWIHKKINTMKMNMTDEEFINWCKLISNHN